MNRLRKLGFARFALGLLLVSVLAIPLLGLLGCGKSSPGSTTGTNAPTVKSIAVTGTMSVVVGQSQQLSATATYSDGSTKDVTSAAAWTSSAATIVSVSSSGSVTGISAGQSTISATLSGVAGTATVTVSPSLKSIAVTGALSLIAGQTQQLAATGTYSDGSTQNLTSSVTWSSSSTAVATIGAGGVITAVSAGTSTVAATLSGVSGTATVTVSPALKSINVTGTLTLIAGQTQQLVATGTYSDGSIQNITPTVAWSSSSTAVATVSSGGALTAVSAGTSTITATLSGVQGLATVTVNAKAIVSISITPGTQTLYLNSTQQFNAIATYNDGSVQDVTTTAQWQSSAPSLAQVSSSGVVTAIASGDASVSASSSSVFASATVTVSSSNSGVTFVDDLTDSRLMLYWPGDGSVVSYYGSRNSDGTIASITSARNSVAGQQPQTFVFDIQGRESTATLSDGTQFGFNWTANPTLAIIAPNQAAVVVVPFPDATSATAAATASTRCSRSGANCFSMSQNAREHDPDWTSPGEDARISISPESSPATSPSVSVTVTTDLGAGPQPEDNAQVDVDVFYTFGGSPVVPIPAIETSPGTGEYTASLPSGPTSLAPAAMQSAAATALSNICKIPIPTSLVCGPEAAACAAAAGALSAICKAQSYTQSVYSAVNLLNKWLPPSVQPFVELNGCGVPQQTDPSEITTGGPYVFNATAQCKPSNISVNPNPATVSVGGTIPLGATASWVDKGNSYQIISSALSWNWVVGSALPGLQDNYLQISPQGSDTAEGWLGGKFSVAIADVAGQNPTPAGVPDTLTAVETNSDENGTSSITVNAGRTDVFLGPANYSLPSKTELQAAVTYTINGIQLPFVPLGAPFYTYAVRVCNVPLGKQFTLDYSINQFLLPIDPFYFYSDNAVPPGAPPPSSSSDGVQLPATYPSGSFTLQASCGEAGCWVPSATQLGATSCVTIPGVND